MELYLRFKVLVEMMSSIERVGRRQISRRTIVEITVSFLVFFYFSAMFIIISQLSQGDTPKDNSKCISLFQF